MIPNVKREEINTKFTEQCYLNSCYMHIHKEIKLSNVRRKEIQYFPSAMLQNVQSDEVIKPKGLSICVI